MASARGRLLTETRTITGQAYTLSYEYDAASNLIQLIYPDGYQLQYTYDAMNRITQVGDLATLTYQKDNRIVSITYGNDILTTYSYDKRGRPTRILTENSTTTLLDLNYAYDANGNLLNVNSNQETYGYDDLNRLTSADGPWGTLDYAYDIVGNRISQTVNGTETDYTYDVGNKLLSAGTTTYTYDNNGNRITQTSSGYTWNYTYDHENRLKQVTVNGQQVLQSWYDGDGRRIKTTELGTTRIFHYSTSSWDPVYVNEVSSGTVSRIVFAKNLRIGRVQAGQNYYYHLDHLGSVRLETRDQNDQVFITGYLPYGTPYATTGSSLFQYTGKQLDQSTGLYYYGYRYYDRQVGRFITQDIAAPEYANPQRLNRYIYALNNPNRYVDPDGRYAQVSTSMRIVGIALIIAGVAMAVASLGTLSPVAAPMVVTGAAIATGVVVTGIWQGWINLAPPLPMPDFVITAIMEQEIREQQMEDISDAGEFAGAQPRPTTTTGTGTVTRTATSTITYSTTRTTASSTTRTTASSTTQTVTGAAAITTMMESMIAAYAAGYSTSNFVPETIIFVSSTIYIT